MKHLQLTMQNAGWMESTDKAMAQAVNSYNHIAYEQYGIQTVHFQLKMPIYVARDLIASISMPLVENFDEAYNPKAEEWHFPELGDIDHMQNMDKMRQLSDSTQRQYKHELKLLCRSGFQQYEAFRLSGVDPYYARIFLHSNHYITYNLQTTLNRIMRYGNDDINAREERKQVLKLIVASVKEKMPLTFQNL